MKLTEVERLILHNQYEILKRIDPRQEKDYQVLLHCLYNGYDEDFDQLLPHFEEPIDTLVRTRVRQILEMFRGLTHALHGKTVSALAVTFAGFDGNEETEYYAYARFLLEDLGLWRESRRDDYNTHYPVLPDYLKMLELWERVSNKIELRPEEIEQLVELAPLLSRKE